MSNEYFINGVQKYTNPNNANYMTMSSDTIDANGTVINPKYLSAMVANTVNPNNLNLVNALSVASASSSPAYTINLQSAPAGVGALWGIDYETTTAEDLQFTTSSATAGVNFNTVGGTTSSRIKNGTIASTSSTNTATITPNSFQILQIGSVFNKSTFAINQWVLQNGLTTSTQFDPTEINITNGLDTARVSSTLIGTNNNTTGYSSTMGVGVSLNTLNNIGTRTTFDGINLGFNTGTSASAITMTTTNVTNGTLTKTWTDILTAGGGGTPTLSQVLTAGNTASSLSAIFTAGTTIRNTISNTGSTISDTAIANKNSVFAINQWDMRETATKYTQFLPQQTDWQNGNDNNRITSLGLQGTNSTTLKSGFYGQANATLMVNNLNGINITNTNIDLGYGLIGGVKDLTITKTSITNTSPALTKTWVSLLSIGTLLQSSLGAGVSITTTRLCQNSLNSGAVIPAGTYCVSYMVTFPSATTTYTTGFAIPIGAHVENSTPTGTLYQYGGSLVNNTGTTGSTTVSSSSVIVFDGTRGCSIGIAVAPTQTVTAAFLQAVRIA
jgi:hypothetical protein